MAREKKTALAVATAGRSAKERHQRSARDKNAWAAPVTRELVALPEKNIKSKHQSYFQVFENHDKKDKRLEFQTTTDRNPPPGFEFVPIGNPELTKACKELSREQEAMIFIVCTAKDVHANNLALQMSRVGHHIRRTIVEQARAQIGADELSPPSNSGEPEPIPETQEEINAQADAALRDLFPRIPNFDKQMIIEHAFKKGGTFQGQPVVGMVQSLPLSRRVQLAVLAHIRHNHTRYDRLLKEADYTTARKVVEKHCLDILVRWRGDEETGRDQFDEILREVVVLSDDSDESSSDEDESSTDGLVPGIVDGDTHCTAAMPLRNSDRRTDQQPAKASRLSKSQTQNPQRTPTEHGAGQRKKHPGSKRANRGFKRYQAVAKRWEEAVNRNRHVHNAESVSHSISMGRVPSQATQRPPSVEIISPVHRTDLPWDDHMARTQQPYHGMSQDHRQFGRPNEGLAANHDAGYPMPLDAPPRFDQNPGPDSAPSEAVVIGRRIGRFPVDSHIRTTSAPQRRYPEDLKDFLVPSIEPASPHSGADVPQFVRQVIRGEPRGPEQVPAGQVFSSTQHPMPPDGRARDVDFYHTDRPTVVDGSRSAAFSRTRPQAMAPREYYPIREAQPGSALGSSEQARRVYRVREPIGDVHRPHEPPMIATRRVVRVHREARPAEAWESEPARIREFSPHRPEPYNRAVPLETYRKAEPRRVVYREASASRFEDRIPGPAPSSAQPPFYEIRRAQPTGYWQGSAYIHPESSGPVRPPAPSGLHDLPPRQSFQELAPVQRAPVDHQHRGRVTIFGKLVSHNH
ncbi:hypothetical protein VM1G_03422 [Cytospora mali]|uniref:DUF2293 domain-containing protein n=1 Tax=Cytospora mali TaxID=578113 RepID=A0A194VTI1_CYTMA|nr:hypothetical protein VM1G_03422 [Valsa mali]